jgi:hypothetical protein
MKRCWSVIVFILIGLSSLGYPSQAVMAQRLAAGEAEKLRLQAENLTDIRSEGSNSFRLTAQLKSFEGKSQAVEGSYELLWKQPTAWRDEIEFAGFSQVRVALGDKINIRRSSPAIPYEVLKLLTLMEFPSLLRLTNEEKIVKVREHKEKGARERVIEVSSEGDELNKRVFYFEWSTPVPTRADMNVTSRPQYFFKDFTDFHGHLFPHALTELVVPHERFEIEVRDLVDEDYGDSDFAPEPNMAWRRWCPHPEPAKYIGPAIPQSSPLVIYPLEFAVAAYGIIGLDGRVHDLAVTKSSGKAVDSWAIAFLKRLAYVPAHCGEFPVEEEFVRYYKVP